MLKLKCEIIDKKDLKPNHYRKLFDFLFVEII